jgi:hypothetical protein
MSDWHPAEWYRVGQKVRANPPAPRFERAWYSATVIAVAGEYVTVEWRDKSPHIPPTYRVHEDDVRPEEKP